MSEIFDKALAQVPEEVKIKIDNLVEALMVISQCNNWSRSDKDKITRVIDISKTALKKNKL